MQLEPKLNAPFRILVVVAHPDDIEFGSGGSVAVWTEAGAEVTYCIVTDGAAGSNDPNMNPRHLAALRKEEQRRAAEVVGVHDVRFLDYPDSTLQATLELRRELTRLIRELRPNRVVVMDPTVVLLYGDNDFNYINHPDHRAAGEAALYAVFPSAETRLIFPELLAEGLEPHHVDEVYLAMSRDPNVAVDTSAQMDRKVQALLCHRSQLDESVIDMIKRWDGAVGKLIDVEYAETYRAMRFYRSNGAGDKPEV